MYIENLHISLHSNYISGRKCKFDCVLSIVVEWEKMNHIDVYYDK